MINRIGKILVTIIVSLVCFRFTNAYAESVPPKVIEATTSVYRIASIGEKDFFFGSSFIINIGNNMTYLATNYHVIDKKSNNLYVINRNGEEIKAKLFAYDEKLDIAILRVNVELSGKALPLNIKDNNKGDEIYAVGFPGAADIFSDTFAFDSEDATITNGIISSIRNGKTVDGADAVMIQISAPINNGNSGGPLFNKYGEVIGINTYSAKETQGIYWAISVKELITIMDNHDLNYSLPNRKPDTEIMVEKAEEKQVEKSNDTIIVTSLIVFTAVIVSVLVIYNTKNGDITCSKCGYINQKSMTFCKKCGNRLFDNLLSQNTNLINDGQVKYCRKCGAKIVPNALFCNKCGNKIL